MLIKVCGLTEPSNINAVVQLDPDYAGLIFVPTSRRYLNPHDPISLPQTRTGFVGVFQDESLDTVVSIAERWSLNGVQLHGNETTEYSRDLKVRLPKVTIFKAIAMHSADSLPEQTDSVDYILLDSPRGGGSGSKFDWSFIPEVSHQSNLIIGGGIGPEDVAALKSRNGISGVDINSRFEESAGIKNIQKVAEFIRQVRSHD